MTATTPQPEAPSLPQDRLKKPFWREWGEAIFIALILALIIRTFVVQAFSIPSGSMMDTLLIGDYLFVNKLSYGIRNPLTNKVWIPIGKPRRGDVVVFIYPQDPTKDYIKRVIAVPGDKVQIINKKVYINDKLTELPQAVFKDPTILSARESPKDNLGPLVVPPDSYFVMGDNRDHSYDSRFWGFVPLDALRGKAFMIYFSWTGKKSQPIYQALPEGLKGLLQHFSWDSRSFRVRWDRIGKIIH
ncbi:MAG: signal peptidase I [Thermodesulfobacteriota bacterium]